MNRERIDIDITDIMVRAPIRKDTGELSMLIASIRKLGLLVPLVIDRRNILIAGSRRLAACREAGLTQVPAIRVDIDHDSMMALDMRVDLNLCREPLCAEDIDRLIQGKKASIARAAAHESSMMQRLKSKLVTRQAS